jgi:hypothetical protein
MDALVPNDVSTRLADLVNWQAFSLTYYESIRRALRLLRVAESEVDELTHTFLIKAAEKNFLDSFREFREREARTGRRAWFRHYLYRSLQHHVVDHHRKSNTRQRIQGGDLGTDDAIAADPESLLDPDALYALDVLHQALQMLRRHCERTGKAHLWVLFEESFLADEFRGRRAQTRAELLARYPDMQPQDINNALTTAKRAFRRIIQEVIPRGLRDGVPPAERFADWMAILRQSNASQFNLLHVAYRVTPFLTADMTQAASLALIVDERAAGGEYEEPPLVPDDDELSLLLSFRLELPLSELLEAGELQEFVPPSSPIWPSKRARGAQAPGRGFPGLSRPFCLLSLIDPTPDEAEMLAEIDLVGLLGRLKSLAKQLRYRPDHSTPEVFAQLLYTTVNVLGLVRCGAELHTIGAASLAGNVRWFLRQSWIDDRLRPLLLAGLNALETPAPPDH